MEWRVATVPTFDETVDEGCIEQKFMFSAGKENLLLDWIEFHVVRDPEFYRSPIISLYYDTPSLDLYREASDGDYLKTKVRLRWYEAVFGPDQQSVNCYLEVKRKYGTLRNKQRKGVALYPNCLGGDLFSNESILEVPALLPELNYFVRGILVPLLVVQYDRYRFVDPQSGCRISLDTGIGCPRANPAYISATTPLELASGVVEVKGSLETLPDFLLPMGHHLTRSKFSKYVRCVERLIEPLDWREPA
ncbi:MAG: VTC domain-containing protein [Candidatus Binatia bacterium]